MQIKQLSVVEQHGILLFRAGDKNKQSSIYVYSLCEFESDSDHEKDNDDVNDTADNDEIDHNDKSYDENEADERDDFTRATAKFQSVICSDARMRECAPAVRSRAHIAEQQIKDTRGCHLYSITTCKTSQLRMVIFTFRILYLFLFFLILFYLLYIITYVSVCLYTYVYLKIVRSRWSSIDTSSVAILYSLGRVWLNN